MKRIVACLLLAFSFAAFAGDAPPAGDKAEAKPAKKAKGKKGDKAPEKKDDKAAEGAKTE
jgi:hypothetical protein